MKIMLSRIITLRTLYIVTILCLFGGLVIAGLISQPAEVSQRVGRSYIEKVTGQPFVSNAVYGIYGIYRFYDTIFELLIFSTAVLGITIFYDLETLASFSSKTMVESHVVTASATFLFPIIALFGFYLAYSGHQGPGGGFAGGVIAGSGVLLLAVAIGADKIGKRFSEQLMKKVEYLILLMAILILLLGLLYPTGFYQNLFGSGVFVLINMAIALKVFIGTWSILHFFVKHRGEV